MADSGRGGLRRMIESDRDGLCPVQEVGGTRAGRWATPRVGTNNECCSDFNALGQVRSLLAHKR